MDSWNAMVPEGKDTILRVVRQEADQFFDLVDDDRAWLAPTGAGHWQVRDIVGHLVDTTESYFVAFDAARNGTAVDPAYGLPGMAQRVDAMAKALRDVPRQELVARARTDFDTMMKTFDELTEEDWTGLQVPHFYMGPLPSFFYPAFQLMDYGAHSWDVRQGTGRAHGLSGEAADLLIPFMFVLWQYTTNQVTPEDVCEIGIRITSGPNAGDTRVSLTEGGFTYAPGDAEGLTVLEFDPGSFVLTAFGRGNAGTIRGDRAVADRFLNMFFRI
ncbi:maleylpyruvate isomerase family mycothiol-dependent enzyme [Terrabacter sp. 2RAF25]|uniref:maleylpyruvate isomerase family mycothiol-dependent enzyme n=1 Tax=Terrabacter sp. 2RAF25 TaxID=3232998 RepID=UPI003F950C5F